jgi:DNA-binding cell septation regulator SpoVG
MYDLTLIKITLINNPNIDYLKGRVSIVVDRVVVIHGLRIIEEEDKYVVRLPKRRTKRGEFFDFISIIDIPLRNRITNKVLSAFFMVRREPDHSCPNSFLVEGTTITKITDPNYQFYGDAINIT